MVADKLLAQQRGGAGATGRVLLAQVGDARAKTRAIAEVLANLLFPVIHDDEQLFDSRGHQAARHMLQDRSVHDGDHRLGNDVGDGAHALADSGGQDHTFHEISSRRVPSSRRTMYASPPASSSAAATASWHPGA